MTGAELLAALDLPAATRVERRVPKTLVYRQFLLGAPPRPSSWVTV